MQAGRMRLGFLLDQRPTRRPRADGNGERIVEQESHSANYKAVRITGPSSVTAMVCSLCAARLPLAVRKVHPSESTLSSSVPSATSIGSRAIF